ncbi:MAG TPA: hypothetical protein VGI11_03280, partial [Variovorax sp.]
QPGEDYVTLAIGRDYSDVSPMRGVLHGGARHTLGVSVTVRPLEELREEAARIAQSGISSQSQSQSQGPSLIQTQTQNSPPLPLQIKDSS